MGMACGKEIIPLPRSKLHEVFCRLVYQENSEVGFVSVCDLIKAFFFRALHVRSRYERDSDVSVPKGNCHRRIVCNDKSSLPHLSNHKSFVGEHVVIPNSCVLSVRCLHPLHDSGC